MDSGNTLKILHTADWHFKPGASLEETQAAAAHTANLARQHAVDLVVITGDLADRSLRLESPAAQSMVNAVQALAEVAVVVVVQGTPSHDIPGSLSLLDKIRAPHPIHVSTFPEVLALMPGKGRDAIRPILLDQGRPGLIVVTIPEFTPSSLKAYMGEIPDPEIFLKFGDMVNDLIKGARAMADKHGVSLLVAAHGAVEGATAPNGYVFDGTGLSLPKASLELADFTALGHVHKPQMITDQIFYAGSLIPQDFSESGPHGVQLLTISPATRQVDWLPVPFTPVITLRDNDLIPSANLTGTRVKASVLIGPDESPTEKENQLRAKLLEAGAAEVVIERVVQRVSRVRAEGISAQHTNWLKLVLWAQVNTTELPNHLADDLALLETNDPDEALTKILAQIKGQEAQLDIAPQQETSYDQQSVLF